MKYLKISLKKKINYLNFLREGDLNSNPTFLEGDIIYVPFGDPYLNSVSLRGHIDNTGYDIIEENESLLSFLNRSIDLINEKLTEINVTSPTGIVQILNLSGIDLAKKLWQKLLKKMT